MIYLFYGSDVEKVRAKAFAWVAAAKTKEPNLAYVRLAKEEITESVLEEASASGSLFAKRTLTLIDDPFAVSKKTDEEGDEEDRSDATVLEEKLSMLVESENVIVILAPKLSQAKAKKLAAKAKMAYVFDKTGEREEVRGFNAGLVNALGTRSSEKLWIEIVRALRAGEAPEALHGLLHWKARDLMEKGSRAYKPSEARALSLALIKLLQDTRRTSTDLSEALERFALSV